MLAVRTPRAPPAAREDAVFDSAFPFERQGRLLRSRSISGLFSRSLHSGLQPPYLRFAAAVTGRHARLGSRLLARLCRGRRRRRQTSTRLQGATRTDPDEPDSSIRLVWGFVCQGGITPFLSSFVIPFFCSTCAASILSSRPQICIAVARSGGQGRRFFSAAEGLSLTDASTAAGCRRSGGWPRDDPRGACHWPRSIARTTLVFG